MNPATFTFYGSSGPATKVIWVQQPSFFIDIAMFRTLLSLHVLLVFIFFANVADILCYCVRNCATVIQIYYCAGERCAKSVVEDDLTGHACA